MLIPLQRFWPWWGGGDLHPALPWGHFVFCSACRKLHLYWLLSTYTFASACSQPVQFAYGSRKLLFVAWRNNSEPFLTGATESVPVGLGISFHEVKSHCGSHFFQHHHHSLPTQHLPSVLFSLLTKPQRGPFVSFLISPLGNSQVLSVLENWAFTQISLQMDK